MVKYKIRIHFALIGDKSSKGTYEVMIRTSSEVLSKLDLERLILVLSARFISHNIKNPSEL